MQERNQSPRLWGYLGDVDRTGDTLMVLPSKLSLSGRSIREADVNLDT